MLYKEWIDFVVYPSDTDRVETREQRLDTQNAIPEIERYYDPELAKKVGFIVNWNDYAFNYDNDRFEAMWIDDMGNVTIWTEKRIWSLHRRMDGKEKMTYVPRNPDLSLLF
jgi:hypothetical protein